MTTTLAQLITGTKAKITNAENAGSILFRRLIDFGVMEGAEIVLVKKLPFGGPVAIEYNGQLIGLRKSDASRIEVEAI
ncbi:FeoA family protein [Gorillibacterium sp. sgz5001074]|uniref:FeoA family protein n=1 Tax=Gorillibacterium sp. sgz5001074 TaxID=3446695 RepID=UPI003F676534